MPAEAPLRTTRSVMLMTTYECQLRCDYCRVDRGRRRMDARTARRGADLLLSSRASHLILNFFGGEPLLEWDLVKSTALYARERRGARPLRINLTTNGLLLDDEKLAFLKSVDGYVHLSLDGTAEANAARLRGTGPGAQRAMEAALRRLDASGLPYHVNAVVDPARAARFDEDLLSLEGLGARRIQFGYRVGVLWSASELDELMGSLDRYAARGRAELLNRTSDSEPVMLSRELIVDVDGALYWDGALFLEAALPKAREALRLGHLEDAPDVDALESSARQPYERLTHAYPAATKGGHVVLNNIKAGLALKRYWMGSRGAEDACVRRGVVQAGLAEQDRFLKERLPGLDRVFLFLRGGCDLDCLFCRSKPEEDFTPLAEVEAFLSGSLSLRRSRIALVGNEPLAHPRIADIARLCRRRGFAEIEVMTSGLRLAALAKPLAKAGVSSYALALHGSRAEVHDAVTRSPGSFDAATRGADAAEAAGSRVFVHASACRTNLTDLSALEACCRARGRPFSIHPLRPKDPAGMNASYREIAPDYAELRSVLTGRVRSLTGFPACVARAIQGSASCPGGDVADSMKLYLHHQAFFKPGECAGCADREGCTGTFEEHLRERPGERKELIPT
ncbi:MAG: radical SAM protein [Elusimicrobiota bacterium]|nr:radical SAM protein [Elusimicrobiota bacterium]